MIVACGALVSEQGRTPLDMPRVDPIVSALLDLSASIRALTTEIRDEREVTEGRLDGIASGVGELAKEVGLLAARAVRQKNSHHRMAFVQAIKSALSVAQSKLSDEMREER